MVISSVGFSLLHAVNIFGGVEPIGVPLQLAMTLLFGMVLAPIALLVGSLTPLIIFHALWDFTTIAGSMLGVNTGVMLANSGVAIVVSIILWGFVIRKMKQQFGVNPSNVTS